MSVAMRALSVVVAVVGIMGIAWASRVPFSFGGDADALLRLSWRIDGTSMEECRQLSEEELANLPIHMRNPEACIGRIAPYHLQVGLDGALIMQDTVYPAGARGDRPIFVFRDFPVEPGTLRVQVRFDPLLPPGTAAGPGAIPLFLDTEAIAEVGRILLVTLDEDGKTLLVR